jgi:hypothetical protein
MAIPKDFDEAFLSWFRERTEATWAIYPSRTPEEWLEDCAAAGVGGCDWRCDTHWLGGLSDQQIARIEWQWKVRFPPDYRLFLRVLHSVDRPRLCARWTPYVKRQESRLESYDGPSFFNWLSDSEALRGRFAWLHEGLEFDIEHGVEWRPSWGPKPTTLDEQKVRVRELVAEAPRLIPVFGHRYLLADPCEAGNPVFSIYQSDIIVYGPDLRTYLLSEFADLLGLERGDVEELTAAGIQANFAQYAAVPFWGDILANP